jgi:ATP-dependent Zn protease
VTYPSKESTTIPHPSPASPQPRERTSLQFVTQRPAFANLDLETRLDEGGVVVSAVDENASSWFTLLVSFGPSLVLIAAFVWLSRPAAAAGGGIFGLGKSPREAPQRCAADSHLR